MVSDNLLIYKVPNFRKIFSVFLIVVVKKIGVFNYFRCRECDWRGLRLTFGINRTSLKTILIYFSLMLATAVIVRFVLQKIALK